MDKKLEDILTEEIISQLTDLKDMDYGSNEKHIAVEDAAKLYGLLLETQKLENEKDRNAKQYEIETQKLENEKDRNAKQYEVETQKLENDEERNENQYEVETKKLENEKDRNAKQYEVETQRLANDKDRNAKQYEVETQRLANDKEYNEKQLAETKKDRYVKIGITAAEIIVAVLFNSFWMKKGYKFEETGCFTSGMFKEFRNHIKFNFKK